MNANTLNKYINEYKALSDQIKPMENRQKELKAKIIQGMDFNNEAAHTTAKGFKAVIKESHRDYIPIEILKTAYADIWTKEHKTTHFRQLSVK